MRMESLVSPRMMRFIVAVLVLVPAGARAQESPGSDVASGPSVFDKLQNPLAPKAQNLPNGGSQPETGVVQQLPNVSTPENFSAAMQIIILLTVLSLAPAILIMMTSFTRIVIVLSLLRQAMGTQQLPPNQILIGLSLFMTFLVMGPTWQRVNDEALQPYLNGKIDQKTALSAAQKPVREFMQHQIEVNQNEEDVFMLHAFSGKPEPKQWQDVSTTTLIPAFMLSELKTAFLMGF